MDVEELRGIELFTGLTDDQLADLATSGDEVPFEPGDVVFTEGEHADEWWVLLEGSLDLVRKVGREDVVVARMDVVGRWAGGFRAWDDNGIYLATGRGATPGRVLRLDAPHLRELVNRWFPLAGHLIGGLHHTARSIESTVRQRDALVTLGTLAAGLAHEINNPAAAASRTVDDLGRCCDALLEALGRLAHDDITAAQFSDLDDLRRELGGSTVAPSPLDALAMADRESEVATWLEGHGVPDAWGLASNLVSGGVDAAWCEQAHEALGDRALAPGLEWVSATVSSKSLLSELKDAVRRISDLVAAVRSYSQMDRASAQRIDVRDGLESTLTMLGHKLKGGVDVVREYADVPQIDAYAGELNQVWTNLIDNAVDAMDGRGTLTIRTRAQGEWVVVELADTGPGMPPEVVARAFEPFFTTKDVGKGTGLGLDIARRIVVERHGGLIEIDSPVSEGKGTVMRVSLPLKPRA
ncbi:MAG TPA: ATP-binding protein [Nocardioides sp.]|uniref:sensor histidine kinase n=1 Tax=Nocardioides sp. TaxID=35761 RepID=UPI002F41F6AB